MENCKAPVFKTILGYRETFLIKCGEFYLQCLKEFRPPPDTLTHDLCCHMKKAVWCQPSKKHWTSRLGNLPRKTKLTSAHSFIQEILIECLLNVRNCSRCWDIAVRATDKNPCCDGAYILVVCVCGWYNKIYIYISYDIDDRSDKYYGEKSRLEKNQGWRKRVGGKELWFEVSGRGRPLWESAICANLKEAGE